MSLRIVKRALCAALLLSAAPIVAATPGSAPLQFGQAASVADPAVAAFYQRRGNQPLWLTPANRGAAATLVNLLRRAELDGLASGPALAAEAEAAIARAAGGNAGEILAAEHLLSAVWVRYVNALRTPSAGMTYADSSLAPRRPGAELILHQAGAASSLAEHVTSIARVNPIYAELRDAAWAQAQAAGGIDARILANLERARALPGSGRYVLVDAAAARLYMVDNGEVVDSMKVVVGKPDSQTPMIASRIHYATLNPYWNVPGDLTQKLIAPRVLAEGVKYLKARGYQVLSGFEEDAAVLDPSSVDWKAVADGRLEVRVRQLPGGSNAMGDVKLFFENSGGIFLHDTPDKALFAKAQRNFSNGCVRLEDARRLTRWLAGSELRPTSAEPEQHVRLRQGVPIYITYLTAQASGGQLTFLDDVYGHDVGTRVAGNSFAVTAR
ncbi:MAG TPA: L,D-transpeptidase family protein [Sphingomicrobium sp.]|nr:L,D-transpeptidase family protein [Sphingomicrobium sp.]